MADYLEDGHSHKFFIYQVKSEFEPIFGLLNEEGNKPPQMLYERVEYAVSGCSCGAAMKTKVQHDLA